MDASSTVVQRRKRIKRWTCVDAGKLKKKKKQKKKTKLAWGFLTYL